MKRFIIILGVIVLTLWAFKAWASPFLVCAPTDQEVTHYLLKWDGAAEAEQVAAFACEDTKVMLKYDLMNLSDGNHYVEVAAKNIWDQSAYVPFDFTKGAPNEPTGIGLSLE